MVVKVLPVSALAPRSVAQQLLPIHFLAQYSHSFHMVGNWGSFQPLLLDQNRHLRLSLFPVQIKVTLWKCILSRYKYEIVGNLLKMLSLIITLEQTPFIYFCKGPFLQMRFLDNIQHIKRECRAAWFEWEMWG